MKAQYVRAWASTPFGGKFYDLSLDMIWSITWAHRELFKSTGRRHPFDDEWTDGIDLTGRVPAEWEVN